MNVTVGNCFIYNLDVYQMKVNYYFKREHKLNNNLILIELGL